ncbi:MAG: SDR family NAD(P)-dependent oxidoreductase [Acidimicrobiales bacterium]
MRDAVGNINSVLVLGGASEIATKTVELLAGRRCRSVVLAVRDPSKVDDLLERYRSLGMTAEAIAFDAADTASHQKVIDAAFAEAGDIDVVISAFGVLGNQNEFDDDPAAAADAVVVNFAGQVSALTAVAAAMKRQGHGDIVVLSSVAGERVRKDNAVYGATKAGLDGFCQGLGDRLVGTGVHVMTVRPGFVHTRMTEGLEPAPFSTTPDKVAADIVAGMDRRATIVWSPAVLRSLFTVMRHLPRPVWRIVSNR